ncbi:MAG TPA: carboxypeptidase regulatory-like domain-containing protein [Streptosporangiaceae bacterium]
MKPRMGIIPDTVPAGYGPSNLQSAYNLPSATAGAGQTVALIESGDDPTAEADLGIYRTQYGLSPCTTANGCFRKVNQTGGTTYPPPNTSWAQETSLDVDMVSAACPNCHILLIEANTTSMSDLGTAVDEAVALGADFVSNSYGSPEAAGLGQTYNAYYNHPGVAVVASSGDTGYGVNYPAASSYVTSVGGTSLTQDPTTARGWSETVWNNSYGAPSSGCSVDEVKPSWQHDSGCANRTVTDVSADADPVTGVAVYDSDSFQGWAQFGGTSVGSPLIASAYAMAGAPLAGSYPASYPYADPSALNDVTSGNNGFCIPAYLCTAGPGYDGPTGLGTPNGVAAFTAGPHGEVTGKVTNVATGKPVAGAQVSTGAGSVTTNARGVYDLPLPAGSYQATASGYTYTPSTPASITVADGTTTKLNFSLTQQPSVTISGQVTDGSGHGWPLYATITASGVPDAAYTNPYTGDYTMTVLASAAYTLQVTPVAVGYQTASQQVTVGTSNITQNVAVLVDSAAGCTAPGYTLTCALASGGMVAGVVTDANTGAGLVGATVTNVVNQNESTTTMATSDDPGLRDGFYEIFAAGKGRQSFTISDTNNYQPQSTAVRVAKNSVTRASDSLQAGDLQASSASLTGTVVSGKTVTDPMTIINTGTVSATFTLAAQGNGGSSAPWLSVTPASGQIPGDGSTTVEVTMTSGDTTVTGQPGSYTGAIDLDTDTPYNPAVEVTMTVQPVKTWGQISGTVTGAACGGSSSTPLANATVEVTSWSNDYSLLTDGQGGYAWWLDQRNSPVTVIASLNGWQPQVQKAKIKAGHTTTVNFTLQPDTSCGAAKKK